MFQGEFGAVPDGQLIKELCWYWVCGSSEGVVEGDKGHRAVVVA